MVPFLHMAGLSNPDCMILPEPLDYPREKKAKLIVTTMLQQHGQRSTSWCTMLVVHHEGMKPSRNVPTLAKGRNIRHWLKQESQLHI